MMQLPKSKSLRQRFNISRSAIALPWLTVYIWLAISVAGLLAFSSLKYALFPDITFPVVVVSAQAPTETSLDTEKTLTTAIEQPLLSLNGLDLINSSSYPGQSVVSVAFNPGINLESATKEVRDNIYRLSLPPQTDIQVSSINLNESAVISYVIKQGTGNTHSSASPHSRASGEQGTETSGLETLAKIAQTKVIPSLSSVSGVLKINLLGDAETRTPDEISEEAPTLVRYNGENGLALEVIKKGDANALDVVNEVQRIITKLEKQLPEIKFILAQTEADYIQEATKATIHDLLLAIILAISIVYPFLRNWRATFITALAIPLSLLGTCIVIAIFGFKLETITLLALALVIGIIVDDAIVDVENISRHIEAGKSPQEAATIGTDEIGMTVTASTLAIAAVFLPIAFMNNTVGQFFKPFGIVISAAVLISLLVSRTLSPVLAIWFLKRNRESSVVGANGYSQGKARQFGGFLRIALARRADSEVSSEYKAPPLWESGVGRLGKYYRFILYWSLRNRKTTIAIALIAFVAGIALIPLIPKGFIPKLDRGEFNIVYTTPLPKLASIFKPENAAIASTKPKSKSETNSIFGGDGFNLIDELAKSPEKILLSKTEKVGKQIETVVMRSPEIESAFTTIGKRGEINKGKIYVKLKENSQLTTAQIQEQIRASLPAIKGVTTSVEDLKFVDAGTEKPLKVGIVGSDLKTLGAIATKVKSNLEKFPGFVDVTATYEKEEVDRITRIDRLNGKRVAYISSNLSQKLALGDATETVITEIKKILPNNYNMVLDGESAHSNTVLNSFIPTLLVSAICMLAFLILPFGRLLEPLVIGLSLPLSIIGSMVALLLTQSDFGIISLIGLVFLIGLLNKNGILLLDYTNQLRQQGLSRHRAILKAGVTRLRPILMTTASTILGMLPIAFGFGAGAELRQPMAVAIIGGLVTCTLLSLIVIPVLYTLLEDLWLKKAVLVKKFHPQQ
jgi:multidrug efflux pump subunit AcrB